MGVAVEGRKLLNGRVSKVDQWTATCLATRNDVITPDQAREAFLGLRLQGLWSRCYVVSQRRDSHDPHEPHAASGLAESRKRIGSASQ